MLKRDAVFPRTHGRIDAEQIAWSARVNCLAEAAWFYDDLAASCAAVPWGVAEGTGQLSKLLNPPRYLRRRDKMMECRGSNPGPHAQPGRAAIHRTRARSREGAGEEEGIAPTSGCGPTLPTFAVQQVVGYLGYSGRAADVVATAAPDPLRKSIVRCSRRKDALREGTTVQRGQFGEA